MTRGVRPDTPRVSIWTPWVSKLGPPITTTDTGPLPTRGNHHGTVRTVTGTRRQRGASTTGDSQGGRS